MRVCSGRLGRRARTEVSTRCVFLQVVLAATALVRGRDGVRGARTRARCNLGFLLCSLANPILSGVGLGLKGLEQEPWSPESFGLLLGVMVSSSLAWGMTGT